MSLEDGTPLTAGLQSYAFCSTVGGIAFGGVASGEDGLRLVALNYDIKAADGDRLWVTLADRQGRKQQVRADLHDWLLVPIARFAATDQHACLTLFGNLASLEETARRRRQGHHILNYHRAFENTLLGLRLLQADIVILYPDACDLPREDARLILGAGEAPPDIGANRRALAKVHACLLGLAGGPFQSYIICDHEVSITFRAAAGRLFLAGEPVWACWKSRTQDEREVREIERHANEEANRVIGAHQLPVTPGVTPSYAELSRRHARVFDEVVSRELLVSMPEYSRVLSAEIHRQGGVNPVVYRALVATMRYAALFRRARQDAPERYRFFLESLEGVRPAPPMKTPAVMIGPR